MKLEEYLFQKDPIRSQNVNLSTTDYKFGPRYKIAAVDFIHVLITNPDFVQKFGFIEYVMVGNSPRLKTVDRDGNPRHSSVFFID